MGIVVDHDGGKGRMIIGTTNDPPVHLMLAVFELLVSDWRMSSHLGSDARMSSHLGSDGHISSHLGSGWRMRSGLGSGARLRARPINLSNRQRCQQSDACKTMPAQCAR